MIKEKAIQKGVKQKSEIKLKTDSFCPEPLKEECVQWTWKLCKVFFGTVLAIKARFEKPNKINGLVLVVPKRTSKELCKVFFGTVLATHNSIRVM